MLHSFFVPNVCTLSVLHQNIAGIFSKKELIEITLEELSKEGKKFDILCLSETFVKAGSEKNISISGYQLATSFSRKKQKRGGVCILYTNDRTFQELTMLKEFSEELVFECCGIEIPSIKCIVICLYRTPSSNVSEFLKKFEIVINKLKRKIKYNIIIAGDINIDTLKISHASTELKRILSNNCFKYHIEQPTRKNSCLDQIMSNIPDVRGVVHNLGLSDHETAQSINFVIPSTEGKPQSFFFYTKRDYCLDNVKMFCKYMKNISWSNVYTETDVNGAFKEFHDLFILLYKLCFPIKKLKITSKSKPQRWITPGLRKSAVTKRKLRFTYYKFSNTYNKTKYLTYTKLYKNCIYRAQKINNARYLLQAKNICKATWEIIRNKHNQLPHKSHIDKLIINNETIEDPLDIASYFNRHFINMTSIPKLNNCKNDMKQNNFINSTMFLLPTNDQEVICIINTLKSTNSAGFDEIQTAILKKCKEQVAGVLSFLINLSFEHGIFPEILKVSIVKPLYKKGCKTNANNYRPISLIPILSKVFERAMHTRITNFLDKFNIIRNEQYGFQKGKSTTLAAYTLTKLILENVDKRTPVTAVFFDMSKAFDFVSHKILLDKCEHYGIRGNAKNWLSTYLHSRKQHVEVRNIDPSNNELSSYSSEILTSEMGVPQGSILGPLLFILYINDLPDATSYDCILYADDISVIIPCRNESNYNNAINETVKNVLAWMGNNNLKANIEKTALIQFVNKNGKKHKLNVTSRDQTIKELSQTTFLGVVIDDKCSWDLHIEKLCNKINSFAYALWRLTKTSNEKVALQAYHGYIGSLLRYALLLWGNGCHANKVFIAQKQCIRAIADIVIPESCRPIFKKYRILTLPCMYIYELCYFVKTNPNLFERRIENCGFNSRYPNKLQLPIMRTTLFSKNAHVMAIKVYNRLDPGIQNLPLSAFRKRLKEWLIQNTFYSLHEYFD